MTREELIETAAKKYCHDNIPHMSLMHFSISIAFEAGAEWADAHPANPWHNVADGDLPKESGDYLCYNGYETRIGWFDTSDNRFYNPYSRFYEKIEVKYWMEVPKSPSERTT